MSLTFVIGGWNGIRFDLYEKRAYGLLVVTIVIMLVIED